MRLTNNERIAMETEYRSKMGLGKECGQWAAAADVADVV